ncbi:MAG TPA: thiamine pyrophosphate-binding protein, partial [Actinomycetota bacterium]|nr:thiamine pyrophosphate-binding protein [Actinomycetota bacterium]
MNVAEYLLARLNEVGVRHVFAVPGDYAGAFLEALDASPGIERIATVNELGAGYAADGYARLNGVGAACVQYGVGGFSILNATAGSYVERLPVVVISASPKRADRVLERTEGILFHHSTGDLRADQRVFANVTAASEVIEDPVAAPAQIDAAFVAMLTERRPIYLEGLADVWPLDCAAPQGSLAPVVATSNEASLTAALDDACARIDGARLPVLWAGVELQRFGLQPTLQAIVDASGMPFTTTSLGKTVLDESQPAFVGTYAGPASPALTRAVMAATDCPVALGTIITDDYLDIMAQKFGQMIEVTTAMVRVGYRHYHQVTMADFLRGLLAHVADRPGGPRAYPLPEVSPDPPAGPAQPDGTAALTYNSFYATLCDFLKREGMLGEVTLVLGESTSLYVFGNLFGLAPNRFVAQAAWGSLGHETGAALGVALAGGGRPFVVAGDGGFRMLCQEVSSLAAQALNAAIFVLSNDAYAIEQAFVDVGAFQPGGSFAPFDLLPSWDYPALAQAFGARGYRVTTLAELSAVLAEIKGLDGVPALVEVVIAQKDLAPQLARLAGAPPELR